jgi:hypothetical protein
LAINPLDLPYLWSMIVAGSAAVVAGVAIALDIRLNPWSKVGRFVRRAMHAPPVVRVQLFADALKADPELQRVAAASPAAALPAPEAPTAAASPAIGEAAPDDPAPAPDDPAPAR